MESESTFRLPAAQMDRFLIRLSLGYPAAEEETRMLQNLGDRIPFETVETVTCAEELVKLQDQAAQVYVSDAVAAYIVALAGATRSHTDLSMGASPRGSRGLYRCAVPGGSGALPPAAAHRSGAVFRQERGERRVGGPLQCGGAAPD